MQENRLTSGLAVLHVVNLGVAVGWWRVAPGPEFGRRALLFSIGVALAWSMVVLARRRAMTPLTAAGVVGVGTLLPWVWIVGIWIGLVALVFTLTTGVFGFLFVALWPLLTWVAFLAVHVGSRWILQGLAGVGRSAQQ